MTGSPVTLVTAGLELSGGGRAVVGRLLASHLATLCTSQGRPFEVLSLGTDNPLADLSIPVVAHGFSRTRLVASILRRQWTGRAASERSDRGAGSDRRDGGVWIYDLLGLARAQVLGTRSANYAVILYGIEVWRPLQRSARVALDRAALPVAISEATIAGSRPFTAGADRMRLLLLTLEQRPTTGIVDASILESCAPGFVLAVGRLDSRERYKGHDVLLDALARSEATRNGVRMVVVGEGDDRARLEARSAALGLSERVRFTGFVSEATLRALYERCAVLALPSKGEGFGLVYLEAMRAAKPVIAARGGAAEEVIVDGSTGRLVDPDDPASVERALVEVVSEPDTARAWGEAGKARFETVFSTARFESRLSELLAELDAAGARRAPLRAAAGDAG